MTKEPTPEAIDALENKLKLFRSITEDGRMTDRTLRCWAEDLYFELVTEKRRHMGFVDGKIKL